MDQRLEWGYAETQPPNFIRGIGIAAFIATLVGVFVLVIDLNSLLKQRKLNERPGKAN